MKVTNLTIIANYIDKNPGCRRTDIKRYLYIARIGEEPQRGYHNRLSNQYFQSYGDASNVYLNKLWYNASTKKSKSQYYLTPAGRRYVNHNINLQLPEGTYVSLLAGQTSIKLRGLIISCNDTAGGWIFTGNRVVYFSHHDRVIPMHG